jgi:predicted aminopeptidase
MRVEQTLRPGQRGTRRFVDRFGDRLVCVRYRAEGDRRVTMVELVVDDRP